MENHRSHSTRAKLVFSGVFFIFASAVAAHYGKSHVHPVTDKLISLAGVTAFLIFSVTFLHVLTSAIRNEVVLRRLGTARAASIQFMLRLVGYLIILLMTLDLLNVSLGKLLLGGAVIGIVLGVAAQQALANFFASLILIVAHPFSVGQKVAIISGGLGGRYEGVIRDVGLTHTKLENEDGEIFLLPNATLLSSATIARIRK